MPHDSGMPRKPKPPSDQPVARRLREVRDALGLSQEEFARGAGIEPNTYNPWETGERPLPLRGAMLLANRYGLSLDWLYLGDPTRKPEWLVRQKKHNPQTQMSE
jgi:transcriptional regulator with XRE-family HTH domain